MTNKEREAAESVFGETLRTAWKAWLTDIDGGAGRDIPREHKLYRHMFRAVWELLQSEAIKDVAVERIIEQRMSDWKDRMKKRLTSSRKFRSQVIEKLASLVVQEWEE